MGKLSKEQRVLAEVVTGRISIDSDGRVWKHWRLTASGKRVEYNPPRRADHPDKLGYCRVGVRVNDKTAISYSHRLVWVLHNGPIPKGMEINHKDGDKTNNRLANLELTTHAENLKHSVDVLGHDYTAYSRRQRASRKLNAEIAREMRRLRKEEGLTYSKIGAIFNVTGNNARAVCLRLTWKDVAP